MSDAVVVIGGSRGLGRAIAERVARDGCDVILTARASVELDEAARTLRSAHGVTVHVIPLDVGALDPEAAEAYVSRCLDLLPVSQVYVTVGAVHPDDAGARSAGVLAHLMAVNCLGACQLVSSFAERLRTRSSNVAVVSSIAAVRARGRNTAYAAAKTALEAYVAGLRHHYADAAVRLQVYRVGYLRTRLSAGVQTPFPLADPAEVAAVICRRRGWNGGLAYVPWYWRFVATGVRLAPWWLFRRLKF